MRFAHHLVSHLTPEWRKHYIQYDSLKKKIYEMVKKPVPPGKEEEDEGLVLSPVDSALQDEFFTEIQRQLDNVEFFYRDREAHLRYTLHELKVEVNKYEVLHASVRTRSSRTTKRKRQNLKLLLSEYYLNLSLLQHFQKLNHTGFRKITKKHDKLACSDRGKEFFKGKVCQSHFWTSPELLTLIETTETLMIEKIEHGNRSKAMNRLRVPPLESKDVRSHWVTLRAGWLMGFIFLSLIVLVLAVVFRPADSWDHLTPTLHGLRVGLLLSIWFYGFAINTYEWRRSGVNNVLIFEFDPRDYLNFVQLFEVASAIGVIFLLGVYFTIFSYWLSMPEWAGPVIMLGLIFVFTVNPLPVLYFSSRVWLLKKLGRIALAPFFFVEFPDFWIADQMNSLAVVLLDLEFFVCYTLFDLPIPGNNVQCGSVKYGLRAFVAVLPAWFRFAQCLRRYYNTKDAFPHLVNAGKYSTSFFVVLFSSIASGLRVENVDVQGAGYYIALVLWIVSGIVSTAYTFTWDVKMDWGLFEGKLKLRSELIYSSKVYYVLAVIENLIFRSLWTINISVGNAGGRLLDNNILSTVLALFEIFRRFVWNFFRLENEHLNNVGQFRAVRDISVHPVQLDELDGGEETVGAADSTHDTAARKMSVTLSQPSAKPTKSSGVRQRKQSLFSLPERGTFEMPPVILEKTTDKQSDQHHMSTRTGSTLPILELEDVTINEELQDTAGTVNLENQEATEGQSEIQSVTDRTDTRPIMKLEDIAVDDEEFQDCPEP